MSINWGSVPKNSPSIVDFYLEEANKCLEQGAYRISVVASACALNFGLDFVLRERKLVKDGRVLSLNKVIEKIKEQSAPQRVINDCEKVMHYRNAFVHPEDYLEVQPSSRPNYYTLEPKFTTVTEKKDAYVASQMNATRTLKMMA